MTILIASCAGGGPMSRLADALSALGRPATVLEEFSDDEWRRLASSGAMGRARARLQSHVVFPIRTLVHAASSDATVLVPTTNPFHLPFLLVATRRLHGKPVVPLVYDLYPDALEAVGASRPSRALSRLMAAANRYFFRNADGVTFIGEEMAAHACRRYGRPQRVAVIETGANVDEFTRGRLGEAAAESSLERWCERKTVIAYVGNLGRMHDWETLARAGSVLFSHESSETGALACVVAASGPGAEALRTAWQSLPASRVRFEAPLDSRAWARLLARASISIVTLTSSARHTSIPSKTFSAMAAGNAIVAVAPHQSDLATVVATSRAGYVVPPGDAGSLIEVLRRLHEDPAVLDGLRHSARTAARDRFDLPVLAMRWAEFLPRNGSRVDAASDVARRAVDIVASAAGLVITAPLLAAAAIAVRATMGPNVFFRQARPGLRGKPFQLMKLRTMRAPRAGEHEVASDAARLTRLGEFLRRTSIDEIPTLVNVLKGDMTIIGPRPLLMQYLDRYTAEQQRRHDVKPGITGWAQVNGRNALSWEEKLRLDTWYVDHRSPFLDLKILALTFLKVLKRDGIAYAGHATMPEFMGTQST